jgi:hypothetical protein
LAIKRNGAGVGCIDPQKGAAVDRSQMANRVRRGVSFIFLWKKTNQKTIPQTPEWLAGGNGSPDGFNSPYAAKCGYPLIYCFRKYGVNISYCGFNQFYLLQQCMIKVECLKQKQLQVY